MVYMALNHTENLTDKYLITVHKFSLKGILSFCFVEILPASNSS